MGSLQWEIVELASHLRNERLFVASEQKNLRALNKEVASASSRLAQLLWILNQQRLNLRRLVLSQPDCPPYVCARRARQLDSTRFVDGHKVLGVQECMQYGDFLLVLRASPRLLAACLTAASQPNSGSKCQSSNSSVSSNSSCDGGSTACGVGSIISGAVPMLSPESLSGIYHLLLSALYCGWDLEDDEEGGHDLNDAWRVAEEPLSDERSAPYILRLLRHLAKFQITTSPDPRRTLCQGSCAFARIYSSMREGLLSLRLFLTAALHKPICFLIESEWKASNEGLFEFTWDTQLNDEDASDDCGPPFEESSQIGSTDTSNNNNNNKKKRRRACGTSKKAVVRLAALVRRFLRSLRANARHFPAPLRWLIAHIRQEMLLATSMNVSSLATINGGSSSDGVSPIVDQEAVQRDPAERVAALCTDLAFTSIVCPAIADPGAHGVISLDMPVSIQARRTFIQVAKALQGLALRPFQEEDPRFADLYGLFDKDCVTSIVECMLEEEEEEEMEEDEEEEEEDGDGRGGGEDAWGGRRGARRKKQRKRRREHLAIPPPLVHSSYTRGLSRSAALITETELMNLVSFLQTVYAESQSTLVDKKQLAALLNLLPATGSIADGKHSSLNMLQIPSASVSPAASKRALLLGKVSRSLRTSSDGWEEGAVGEEDATPAGSPVNGAVYRPASPREDVLIIPLGHSGGECIGMLPEGKVLEMEWDRRRGTEQLSGKRTRFSLSHDEIVSTLKGGEVDSTNVGDGTRSVEVEEEEAVSNHSVASSLELEEEVDVRRAKGRREPEGPAEEDPLVLDNLSDMVSANVSSRGTPNISGRDTPSSQITEGDGEEGRVGGSVGAEEEDGSGGGAVGGLPEEGGIIVDAIVPGVEGVTGDGGIGIASRGGLLPISRHRHPISKHHHQQQQQQTRSDIDDKFGKFEIKKLMEGDETVSLVSDTWSTDVLASDSETVDLNRESAQMNLNPLTPAQPIMSGPTSSSLISIEDGIINVAGMGPPGASRQDPSTQLLDISETGSEAWSVDVMASDYERMCEVDTDDAGSVARSDDTARSELEAEGVGLRGEMGPCEDHTPRTEEKTTHQLHNPRGPSPSSRGLSPGPATSTFRPIREEEEALISGEIELPTHCQRPMPRYFTGVVPRQGLGEGKLDGPLKLEEDAVNLKPPVKFSVQSLDAGADPTIGPPNQILMHELNSAESPTSMKQSIHEHHQRRRNLPTKALGIADSVNMLPGQGSVLSNGIIRDEEEIDDEEDDDAELEEELEAEFLSGSGARLSSTSLASSSSSSGIEGGRRRIMAAPVDAPPGRTHSLPPIEILNSAMSGASFSQQPSQGRDPLMGAIPKSISFDKTAERGDKDLLEEDHKQKRSFFRNFKLPFKGRVRKPGRGNSSVDDPSVQGYDGGPLNGSSGNNNERLLEPFDAAVGHSRLQQQSSIDSASLNQNDSMEDILAKYRRKPEVTAALMGSSPISLSSIGVSPVTNGSGMTPPLQLKSELGEDSDDEDDPEGDAAYRLADDEEVAFEDAKRKLRMVLSSANVLHPLEGRPTARGLREAASSSSWTNSNGGHPGLCVNHRLARNRLSNTGNELVSFLRLQLAEAVSLHSGIHHANTIHIRETLRCVMAFDNQRCCKLFRALRDDYRRRAPYLAYLVRCKQGLISTLTHLERLLDRIGQEREACSKSLVWVCVHLYVKRHERDLNSFVADFDQPSTTVDEKADLLRSFLKTWNSQMEEDPTWHGASEQQLEFGRISVERIVIGRVYSNALYPNGDGDISRDQVLHEHMKKLSKMIKPGHKDLRIPKAFWRECPWPSAQAEISLLGNFCTPRDKVACVSRTCTTLITLLAMASNRSDAPAADDLIPVLVYVLIKANPPSLLSTIQFVNSFFGSYLVGADQYWWVQFCSSIEFIKTMDYSD